MGALIHFLAINFYAENAKHNYDESKIKTLSSLEHIRLRTGMYIGRIGTGAHPDDGCYILLKEVVDNAIDEYIMGHGREVEIKIEGTHVSVRDFGRGIPLGKVVDCVSKINTGAKYNDDVFQFSVGSTASVPRRSTPCRKRSWCAAIAMGNLPRPRSRWAKLKKENSGKSKEPDGTFIEFEPDPEIFKEPSFATSTLNAGCAITATSTRG